MPVNVNTPALVSYRRRLDNAFGSTKADIDRGALDDYAIGLLSEALCMRVSGFLEVFFREVFAKLAAETSMKAVARYVKQELSGITNLNAVKATNTVRYFSPALADELSRRNEMRDDGEWKSALDSIYNLRINLAHARGGCERFSSIYDYYGRIKAFADFLLARIPVIAD